ncbi:hypothetical protein ABZ760_27510 [Streptomyces sp. NPDC006658]|uniref:hypothetical protein n=1 Tax=Streptomyces sp. NPDC006658 TaxID=3156900 RepID=UPI0033FC130C
MPTLGQGGGAGRFVPERGGAGRHPRGAPARQLRHHRQRARPRPVPQPYGARSAAVRRPVRSRTAAGPAPVSRVPVTAWYGTGRAARTPALGVTSAGPAGPARRPAAAASRATASARSSRSMATGSTISRPGAGRAGNAPRGGDENRAVRPVCGPVHGISAGTRSRRVGPLTRTAPSAGARTGPVVP